MALTVRTVGRSARVQPPRLPGACVLDGQVAVTELAARLVNLPIGVAVARRPSVVRVSHSVSLS